MLAAPPQAPPLKVQWATKRTADGTAQLTVPSDWTLIGEKGSVLALNADSGAGFISTVFQIMPSNYGVRPPAGVLVLPGYRGPTDKAYVELLFRQFRTRDVRVKALAAPAIARQCAANIGGPYDAAVLAVTWTTAEGVRCAGGFTLINSRPSALVGHWFSILAGAWGPRGDLPRFYPVLSRVASSWSIDSRFVKIYIDAGLERLHWLQATFDINDFDW